MREWEENVFLDDLQKTLMTIMKWWDQSVTDDVLE